MNSKEIGEIRRRFRAEKSNITRVRGCLINEKKEIISRFDQSLSLMSVEESEEVLALLRRTLSGRSGRNLLTISFSNQQVLDSDEHRLLSSLRTSLDDASVEALFDKVRETFVSEGNYLILVANDSYDVPSYGADGNKKEDGGNLYSYVLCAICPIKMTKSALGYRMTESVLRNVTPDWVIGSPEAGFLFPAFDGRQANIYNALYYTRSASDNREELIDALFRTEAPLPAAAQKQIFSNLFRDTVADACSMEVVRTVQEQVSELIEEHKALKDPEPLTVTKATVTDILRSSGLTEEKVTVFGNEFDRSFGAKAEVPPENIVDVKKFAITTPEVSIRLSSEMAELIETRVIDGQKYILIRADGIVEVNGVEISINE